MNLDETSVCIVQKPLHGVVMKTGRRLRSGAPSRLGVKRSLQRTNITYVALVSDDQAFTAELPQFIIGDARSFTTANYPRYFQAAPRNVFLLVAPKAWNNWMIMQKIIRVLGLVGRTLRPHSDIIFLLDTANPHINDNVLATAHEEGVRLVLIPARCTSLLQPLDVYVFRLFKEKLRRRFHDLHGDGTHAMNVETLLRALYHAIYWIIMGRDWPLIFEKCGFSRGQMAVSDYLQRHLTMPAQDVCATDATALCDADIAALLPANRRITLREFLRLPPPDPLLAVADGPAAAPPVVDSF